MYGSESWITKKTDESHIEALEMKGLRQIQTSVKRKDQKAMTFWSHQEALLLGKRHHSRNASRTMKRKRSKHTE